MVHTRVHTQVGFANPFLVCEKCDKSVPYWHDPDRCGCEGESLNYPCGHKLGTYSTCPTWSPVGGCLCEKQCKK